MNAWTEGIIYAALLAAGTGAGWLAGRRLRLRATSTPTMAATLAAVILGGSFFSTRLLGSSITAHAAAVLVVGVALGVVFWPLGEGPRERKRL